MAAGRYLGVGLNVVGALALGFGLRIESVGLGQNSDPGPKAFPFVLAGILILGGIYELVVSVMAKGALVSSEPTSDEPAAPGEDRSFSFAGWGKLLFVFLGLVIYVGLIPWLGFTLSTLLFAIGMMRRLDVGWVAAVTTTIGLLLVVNLLFVRLFKVQMPTGQLGLPF